MNGSRPGMPGAAEAVAGRGSAGQPEGAAVRADGRPDTPAAAATQSAAGQAAPAAPTPAQLAPKLLALLDALRSASTAAPAQPGAAAQAALLRSRAARWLRLPKARRSPCQPPHLRARRQRTRQSPTGETRGWGAC